MALKRALHGVNCTIMSAELDAIVSNGEVGIFDQITKNEDGGKEGQRRVNFRLTEID